MKSGSRPILGMVGLAVLFAFGATVTAQNQNREKYIISATAGGINFVSGNVTVQRKGASRQEALTSKDNLKTGDSVTTGAGGRVEVLLNPGSYMRLDENSEFVLVDASLDSLRVKLDKGKAILEVSGADDIQVEIEVSTPQTDFLVIKRGIYRFNILPNDVTEFSVLKGRALYGKGMLNEIKGGRKILVGRGQMEVAKFDKKNQDQLDIWSKSRAETLAHANRGLQSDSLTTAFNDYAVLGIMPSSQGVGLWVYSTRLGGFCFIPFGSRDWSSPYGYNYRTGLSAIFGLDLYAARRNGSQVPDNGAGREPRIDRHPGTVGNTDPGGSTRRGRSTGDDGNTGSNPNPDPAPQRPEREPTYQPPTPPPAQPIERAPVERTPIEMPVREAPIREAPIREAPPREAPPRESANPND